MNRIPKVGRGEEVQVKKKRPNKGSDVEGDAWTYGSINDARAVYHTALATSGFVSDTHDSSLDTGFFANQPVLVFLWGPTMNPALVASVQRVAVLGGGNELAQEVKQELLRQARLRWRALRGKRPKSSHAQLDFVVLPACYRESGSVSISKLRRSASIIPAARRSSSGTVVKRVESGCV